MSQRRKLNSIKVGVDFGTTYSGIAWAHSSTPEKINVVCQWVSGRNRTSGKAPSEIAYTSSGVKWGFGIPVHESRLAWFKLLLDPTKYHYTNATNSPAARAKMLLPSGKKPVDVVTDYLSELYKHTIDQLEKTLGKYVVEVSLLDFTLTVPAVWSDAAKDLTLQAAERAGFGRQKFLRLISEPEAAAVCCLKEMEPDSLKVGDTFVVADCGGGTVDVISYTITRKLPKLEVVECVPGTGALCGSTILNERFERLVRDRVGDRFDNMKQEGRVYMVKEFNDSLKQSFTDSENEDIFTCPIPGVADDAAAGIEAGMFILDRDDMRGIFDPVVRKITQVVQQQVDEVERLAGNSQPPTEGLHPGKRSSKNSPLQSREVKAIVLVGGFGESEYLRRYLEAEIRTTGSKRISILQPPNAWTAVVRGAVTRGLEGEMVRIRKAVRSYGTNLSALFLEGVHPTQHGYFCPYDGDYKCENRMDWYIRKGEDVEENVPIRHPFYNYCRSVGRWADKIELPLLAHDSPDPPDDCTSPDIYTVCTLEVDTGAIPKEKFQHKIDVNGKPYLKLQYDLLMTMQSAFILFEIEVDGTVYGDVRALYNFDLLATAV